MTWIDEQRKKRELDHEPKYGPIRPKTDPRCFRREALEELLDTLNYAQWSFQKGEITKNQFQRIDRTTRIAIWLIEEACRDRFGWGSSLSLRP